MAAAAGDAVGVAGAAGSRAAGFKGWEPSAPSIPEIVERIGFGRGQIVASIFCAGPFVAEGMELLLLSLLVRSISSDLRADHYARGFMVSVTFLGTLIGNVVGGPVSDLAGRQWPITSGYFLVILFSGVSSFMNSMHSIALLRMLVGFGFGFAQPAAVTLLSEIAPKSQRPFAVICPAIALGIGVLIAVLMVTLEDVWFMDFSELQWRLLLRCASIPLLLLGFGSIVALPESPQFLAESGDFALARDILSGLAVKNRRPEVDVQFRLCESAAPPMSRLLASFSQIGALLQPPTLRVTLPVCLAFLGTTVTLYGTSYAVPQVLTQELEQALKGWAPSSVLLLSFLLASAVLSAGARVGPAQRRKFGIIASLCLTLASALLFAFSASMHEMTPRRYLLMIASCFGLIAGPAFSVVQLAEAIAALYPAQTSASAISACLTLFHIGATVAPLPFIFVVHSSRRFQPYFLLLAALQVVCLVFVLPVDLRGAPRRGDDKESVSA